MYLFYFWLFWVFTAACRLFSSCGEQGLLFTEVCTLLTVVASLVAEHGLWVWVQSLWHMDLVAQWHVGSSRTRDGTHVPALVEADS